MRKDNNHHRSNNSLQKEVEYTILDHLTFQLLFRKLIQSIRKTFTALQYYFHQMTFGAFTSVKLPWFQVAVLAFGVFILFKKDLHFQVRMKAPLSGLAAPASYDNTDQLSMTPSFSWLDKSAKGFPAPNLEQEKVEDYIKRFAKVAVMEQERFGIPASIKMAQAILESQAGMASLTVQTNNHFGKAFSNESFGSAWESWRAHSLMMTHENSKFRTLLRYGKDYKSWAKALETMQYSDIESYGEALIQLIEKYEMYRMDEMKS